jgi:hypothetical protein
MGSNVGSIIKYRLAKYQQDIILTNPDFIRENRIIYNKNIDSNYIEIKYSSNSISNLKIRIQIKWEWILIMELILSRERKEIIKVLEPICEEIKNLYY